MTQIGVVLLAHGSRGDNANDGLFEVAQALRERSQYKIIQVGFMQRNFPTIEEAARSCVLQGAEEVLLIPYFLHVGLHMQDDLPETVELLKALHPQVRFAFGKPFARHPGLVDIVLDRIEECRQGTAGGSNGHEELDDEDTPSAVPSKPLRTGYTTGACAAAAAKAAAQVLITQKRVIRIDIPLPSGQRVILPVGRCEIRPDWVRCSVIKDAGDDPDVTDGAEICVSVGWTDGQGIAIRGGEGVGVVTKPGLGLAVGVPAINPVPRQMIETCVAEGLGPALNGRGVMVEVTVPAGEAYARKTLNRRLGIVGGISILGTTGIVQPFSASAYTAVVAQSLDVAVAAGSRHVVLTTGRRTERFAQALLSLPEESFIQVGDFVGFALKQAVRREIPRATLCLMIGKLCKLAAGHFQTHVSNSSVDQSNLAQIAAEAGVSPEVVTQISQANTARHAAEILQEHGVNWLFATLCDRVAQQSRTYIAGKMVVECLLVDFDGKLLGRSAADG